MDRSWLHGANTGGKRNAKGAQGNGQRASGAASTQHWQAGFSNPGAPKGGAGNDGRRAITTEQLVQSVGDLKTIADMGSRWGTEPEVDQRVRVIVSDIRAALASAQKARNTAMDEVSMKFGIDLFDDGSGQASASAPARRPEAATGGHRAPPAQVWQEDAWAEHDWPQTASGPDTREDDLVQALGSYLLQQGLPSSQPLQWNGAPTVDPSELQRAFQAVQAMQGQSVHGGGWAAGSSNVENKSRSHHQPSAAALRQDPQDYRNMGAYVGQPDSGGMGADMNSGIGVHMQDAGGKGSASADRLATAMGAVSASPAISDSARLPSVAESRRLQMAQPSGYVVKNTFIEPAEDAEESEVRQMRASAVLFRSEQGLNRKMRYNSDIMEELEDEDPRDDELGQGGLGRAHAVNSSATNRLAAQLGHRAA